MGFRACLRVRTANPAKDTPNAESAVLAPGDPRIHGGVNGLFRTRTPAGAVGVCRYRRKFSGDNVTQRIVDRFAPAPALPKGHANCPAHSAASGWKVRPGSSNQNGSGMTSMHLPSSIRPRQRAAVVVIRPMVPRLAGRAGTARCQGYGHCVPRGASCGSAEADDLRRQQRTLRRGRRGDRGHRRQVSGIENWVSACQTRCSKNGPFVILDSVGNAAIRGDITC